MKRWILLLFFIFIRLVTVFVVQTWYVPDEYWQTVEVAHKLAFGYGYLTWEWIHGIRSYVYPLMLAGVFHILKYLSLDSLSAVVYAPRIFQALISAGGDYCFWRWYYHYNRGGTWAAFVIVTNWFSLYCGSRTLINSFEATLHSIALSIFPWNQVKTHKTSSAFLWFVVLACILRPTAAIIWIPICIYHIALLQQRVLVILKEYIPIGSAVAAAGILLDSYFYGRIISTLFNFFKINIVEGINVFYGSHEINWYLTVGIPVVLGFHLIPFILGVYKIVMHSRKAIDVLMLVVIAWTVAVLSIVPHKEFRFLLPLMPFFMYIETSWLSSWSRKAHNSLIWFASIVMFIGNAVLLGYFGLVHQRGTLDVMKTLASLEPGKTNLMFLMPCHSTPLYSHLHVNITTRFLTCEPDFNRSPHYQDEAEIFYANPEQWLRNNFSLIKNTTHIVIYNVLHPRIKNFLNQHNYKLTNKIFHTFHPSGRVGNYVEVYTKYNLPS